MSEEVIELTYRKPSRKSKGNTAKSIWRHIEIGDLVRLVFSNLPLGRVSSISADKVEVHHGQTYQTWHRHLIEKYDG